MRALPLVDTYSRRHRQIAGQRDCKHAQLVGRNTGDNQRSFHPSHEASKGISSGLLVCVVVAFVVRTQQACEPGFDECEPVDVAVLLVVKARAHSITAQTLLLPTSRMLDRACNRCFWVTVSPNTKGGSDDSSGKSRMFHIGT